MSGGTIVTLYANVIAIMLMIGVFGLAHSLKMKDHMEKIIFLLLLFIVMLMSVFYILCALRDDGILPCNKTGALLLETVLELLINIYAFDWFIYVDYRIYHSVEHIKRDRRFFMAPFVIISLLFIINIFTGIMIRFDDDLTYLETPLYNVTDIVRLLYFIGSLVLLEFNRRKNDKLRFFSVRAFFIPTVFFVLLYYFTPYATVALGLAIGLALIYVQLVNNQCFQDTETGFYNRLYLQFLKDRIEKKEYVLSSAIMFSLPDCDIERSAKLISDQLPEDCDTIRYGRNTVVTLAHVTDRSPLHMLSEDVESSFEEANVPITVTYDLRKKKENGIEFLNRFLEKA